MQDALLPQHLAVATGHLLYQSDTFYSSGKFYRFFSREICDNIKHSVPDIPYDRRISIFGYYKRFTIPNRYFPHIIQVFIVPSGFSIARTLTLAKQQIGMFLISPLVGSKDGISACLYGMERKSLWDISRLRTLPPAC